MDTKKAPMMRFVVLVPHRDALKPLEEYRQRLFAAGIYSAHSFPLSAPLAEVSHPFSREELKGLALSIRNFTEKTGGKILTNNCCTAAESRELSFFGPPLNLPINDGAFPETAKKKLLCVINPPVLCAALAEKNLHCEGTLAVSFRAAYVANLGIRQIAGAGFSFEWRIGKPAWLPAYKKCLLLPKP